MSTTRKTVLVTGATRGLGLAIARRLVGEGYHVVGTGRALSDETRALEAESDAFVFRPLELGDAASIRPFVSRLRREHPPLYGLVNNAAVSREGLLATLHESEIEETIAVNVTGTILLTKYAVRSMLLHGEGRVVNVSSIVGSTGFRGLSVYGASKAALLGLTYSLAREVGRAGITVNALAPGYMKTDMTAAMDERQLGAVVRRTPLQRLPTTDEVAAAASYLLGPDAAMVTGTVLTVDGGSTA